METRNSNTGCAQELQWKECITWMWSANTAVILGLILSVWSYLTKSGVGHRVAMFWKRVSPDGCNGYTGGNQGVRQKVQSFASFSAASTAPDNILSRIRHSSSAVVGSWELSRGIDLPLISLRGGGAAPRGWKQRKSREWRGGWI